ncbi:hypothetical protein EHS13_30460 [Paenibacillus psychroresistens]|uniref:YhfM-like domain-containing protein n=1 Tax=Paenibacillus psychroresistens TaxID=1778678 RepID=A0A6B8RTK3_9BACL|nr:hypothetical protein [Paenibacillus psychroresistens]QGQ98895.1 hypothetical protein EHS13_30460 [Paenibacillus psychroresistens]
MKKSPLMMCIIMLFGLVVGCERAGNEEIDEQVVQRVSIAKSLAHGSVNPALLAEYTNEQTIEKFTNAEKTANKIQGILNTSTPNFDMTFILKDEKKSFHLWLSEKSELGMIMKVNDTSTGYSLTKESTAELLKIINESVQFRTIAWAAVEESQKPHVTGNWEEALVSTIIFTDQWLIPNKDLSKFKNQELVTVNFSTDQDGLLGPIVVVINPVTNEVVGFYPRY